MAQEFNKTGASIGKVTKEDVFPTKKPSNINTGVEEPQVFNKGQIEQDIRSTLAVEGIGGKLANDEFINAASRFKLGRNASQDELTGKFGVDNFSLKGATVKEVTDRFGLGDLAPAMGQKLDEVVVNETTATSKTTDVNNATDVPKGNDLIDFLKDTTNRTAGERETRNNLISTESKTLQDANDVFSEISTRIKNQDLINVQLIDELGDKPIPNISINVKKADMSRDQERARIFDMMEYNRALAAVQVAQGNYSIAESTVKEMADDQKEATEAMIKALEIEGKITEEESTDLREQNEVENNFLKSGYIKITNQEQINELKESGQLLPQINNLTGEIDYYKKPEASSFEVLDEKVKKAELQTKLDQLILQKNKGSLSTEQLKLAQSLAKELKNDAAYKDMLDINTGFLGVVNGLSQENGFGDIAAINAFQRMIDPGATVREGDVALMEGATAWLKRIAPSFVLDKLEKGDKLPPSVRNQMIKLAKELYTTRKDNYNDSTKQIKNRADSGNIDFDKFIFSDFADASEVLNPVVEYGDFNEFYESIDDKAKDEIDILQDKLRISDDDMFNFIQEQQSKTSVGDDTNKVSLNRPQRNLNPGNVKRGGLADKFAIQENGKPKTDDQGHLIFKNKEEGFKALEADVKAKITGGSRHIKSSNPTLSELGKVYAEDGRWASSVARILGVNPDVKTNLIDFNKLIQAIATQEGFYV